MKRSTMLTSAAAVGLAMALSTGAAEAQSIGQSLFSKLIGGEDDSPAINYSERAPLVLPGQRTMRAPEEANAEAENPAWPKDPDVKKKRKKAVADGRGPASGNTELLSQDELATGSLAGARQDQRSAAEMENEYNKMSNPVSPTKLRRKGTFGASAEPLVPGVEAPRAKLVEPPSGYRKPLATASVDPDAPLPSEVAAAENKPWYQKVWDFQK